MNQPKTVLVYFQILNLFLLKSNKIGVNIRLSRFIGKELLPFQEREIDFSHISTLGKAIAESLESYHLHHFGSV